MRDCHGVEESAQVVDRVLGHSCSLLFYGVISGLSDDMPAARDQRTSGPFKRRKIGLPSPPNPAENGAGDIEGVEQFLTCGRPLFTFTLGVNEPRARASHLPSPHSSLIWMKVAWPDAYSKSSAPAV